MKRFKRFLPTSFRRGSVLAYTLILLSVVLVAAIGIAAVSVTNERGSLLSSRSVSSFQVADTGSQAAIVAIREALSSGGSTLNDLTVAGGGCSNSGGVATIVSASSGTIGKYTLTFYDNGENQLDCSDDLSQIATVKSVGEYRDTSRAVKVAVAASSCDTPGQVVMVAKNTSGSSITPSDISKVSSFANDVSKTIVGFHCNTGFGTITGSASLFSLIGSSGFGISGNSSSSASMGCLVSGGCSASSNVCSGGWAVYGICTVDN